MNPGDATATLNNILRSLMNGKKENITITLKKADRITMKFLDGKILSGEVTNIKADCDLYPKK